MSDIFLSSKDLVADNCGVSIVAPTWISRYSDLRLVAGEAVLRADPMCNDVYVSCTTFLVEINVGKTGKVIRAGQGKRENRFAIAGDSKGGICEIRVLSDNA